MKEYIKPKSLKDVPHIYCPGCGHGIVHRLIAEVIDELGIREKTIGVAPVGCAVFAYDYFNFDVSESPHGRAPAIATGIKRSLPDRVVFTYQGDGDLAAIGTTEFIHAAARGEKITIIFINNANYGMTGGQMAPTTLLSQKTQTTPFGRDADYAGYPIKVCELLSSLDGVVFLARCSVNKPKEVIRTKNLIRKAFSYQLRGLGFSLVEILSQCPVNWHLTVEEACKWIDDVFSKTFPLGVFKDIGR